MPVEAAPSQSAGKAEGVALSGAWPAAAEEWIVFGYFQGEEIRRTDAIGAVRPNGTGFREIFSLAGQGSQGYGKLKQVRIAPDGLKLGFLSNLDGLYNLALQNVFYVRADGTGLRQISGGTHAGEYLTGNVPESRGSIRGHVLDQSGYPAGQANLYVEGVPQAFKADAHGDYQIADLPVGSRFVMAYNLIMSHGGNSPTLIIPDDVVLLADIRTNTMAMNLETVECFSWWPDSGGAAYEHAHHIWSQPLDKNQPQVPLAENQPGLLFSMFGCHPGTGGYVFLPSIVSSANWRAGMYVASADFTMVRKVINDPYRYISYAVMSPDGTRIALERYASNGYRIAVTDATLENFDLPEGDAPGYTEIYQAYPNDYLLLGNWSPDGEQLVFTYQQKSATGEPCYVITARVDRSGQQTVYGPQPGLDRPDWGLLESGGAADTPTATPPAVPPTVTPTTPSAVPTSTPAPTFAGQLRMDGNRDGRVDALDFLILRREWHRKAPPNP